MRTVIFFRFKIQGGKFPLHSLIHGKDVNFIFLNLKTVCKNLKVFCGNKCILEIERQNVMNLFQKMFGMHIIKTLIQRGSQELRYKEMRKKK